MKKFLKLLENKKFRLLIISGLSLIIAFSFLIPWILVNIKDTALYNEYHFGNLKNKYVLELLDPFSSSVLNNRDYFESELPNLISSILNNKSNKISADDITKLQSLKNIPFEKFNNYAKDADNYFLKLIEYLENARINLINGLLGSFFSVSLSVSLVSGGILLKNYKIVAR
ncbi:hypothetical protein [Mesomycoplasma molare]|uniref:ABC transporter permease n=1 Tax=Mesomycoplasma molare TaxID=171288 RepID=A0ABY5TVM1_9BACT|nr:hypothetical protein [Mesomycoplasma molare]UWD34051.1 hypothetical protein NX772_03010 [Mesomycoplasma molare]